MTGAFGAFTAIYFEGIVSLIHLSQPSMIYHGLRVLSDPRFYTSLPVGGKEVHAAERLKLCKHEKASYRFGTRFSFSLFFFSSSFVPHSKTK